MFRRYGVVWWLLYIVTKKKYIYIHHLLVGGFNHLEKYESQWEGLSHILWKIKNVPNHQPVNVDRGLIIGGFHLRSFKYQVEEACPLINKLWFTSSTAQGGGGSFKNRKPIGEIGCCESGMAERIHWWTERCLRSPLFLSLSLTIYLPTYLSSMYLSIYRSISLSLSSNYLSVYPSIYLSLSLSFI